MTRDPELRQILAAPSQAGEPAAGTGRSPGYPQ